jgi:hypothetical protein
MSDSRLSCGELRAEAMGTIAALGTALRAEWKELRLLCGPERAVLRDAEREWLIEVDVDVWDWRRLDSGDFGSLAGGSILFTLGISEIGLEWHALSSVTTGS